MTLNCSCGMQLVEFDVGRHDWGGFFFWHGRQLLIKLSRMRCFFSPWVDCSLYFSHTKELKMQLCMSAPGQKKGSILCTLIACSVEWVFFLFLYIPLVCLQATRWTHTKATKCTCFRLLSLFSVILNENRKILFSKCFVITRTILSSHLGRLIFPVLSVV